MEALNEWKFEFSVSAADPIPRRMMEDLLCLEALPWAEERDLGIGGGFRSSSGTLKMSDHRWHYSFGLCVQGVGLLIPRSQAEELFAKIVGWCRARGFRVAGACREFRADELV